MPPVPYAPIYPPAPWGYNYVAPRRTDGRATASLVCSIMGVWMLAWGVGAVLGLIGALLGHSARRRIRATGDDGHGMATAGVICGWIAFGLGALVVILFLSVFIGIRSNY
jgi:hypothetical protein